MNNKTSIVKPVDGWEHRLYERLDARGWALMGLYFAVSRLLARVVIHSCGVERCFPDYGSFPEYNVPLTPREAAEEKRRIREHDALLDVTDADRSQLDLVVKKAKAATSYRSEVVDPLPKLAAMVGGDQTPMVFEWIRSIETADRTITTVAEFLYRHVASDAPGGRGNLRLQHDQSVYLSEMDAAKIAMSGISSLLSLGSAACGVVRAFRVPASQNGQAAPRPTINALATESGMQLRVIQRMQKHVGIKGKKGKTYSEDELARMLRGAVGNHDDYTIRQGVVGWSRKGWLPAGFNLYEETPC